MSGPDATVAHVPAAEPPPLVAVPGFAVERELGRGGMGVVYLARQEGLNRPVALKMVLAGVHASPAERERFRAEGEAVARLRHPNVVAVHAVGEADGRPFVALEFCPRGSLDALLNGEPLSAQESAELVRRLASGVAAAHAANVVHRDLKPANVLLAEGDGDAATPIRGERLVPKVADFGLARDLASASQTGSGAIVGTPSYMAPEQAAGSASAVCPATDVYALGSVLYECLTGRPPFRAASVMETLHAVLSDEPASPRLLVPGVPRDLETVTLKCLAKEPRCRYPDAAALAADLERFASGRPVLARPVGRAEAAWRWCRRNPRVALLSMAVVLSLTLGAVVSGWLALAFQREATAAREAESQQRDARESASRALYLARVQLARVAWGEGNLATLGRHLDAAKPSDADPVDRRGFEWHYLDTQRRPEWEDIPLPGAQNVQFLDGRTVQYFRPDGTPARFDLEARRELPMPAPFRLPKGVKAYSVARDGKSYATLDKSGDVEWWALEAGAWKRRYAGRPLEGPRDVQVTAGPLLVTARSGGTVAVAPDGRVESVVAPRATTNDLNGRLAEITATARAATAGWASLYPSADDALVLVVGYGQTEGAVFDGATGRVRFRLLVSEPDAAWSGDGSRLAVRQDRDTVAVVEATTGRAIARLSVGPFESLALSGDGGWLAASSPKGTRLFEVETGGPGEPLPGVAGPVALTPLGDRLYAQRPGAVTVWATAAPPASEALEVATPILSPNGGLVYTPEETRVRALDTATFRETADIPCPAGRFVAGDDDASAGVSVSRDGLWFWERGAKPRRVAEPKKAILFGTAYHTGTRRVCVEDHSDGRLRVWEAATGRELVPQTVSGVGRACFSADGRWLVRANPRGVTAYDLDGGAEIPLNSPPDGAKPCYGTPGGVALLGRDGLFEWRCAENRLEPIASGLGEAVTAARHGDRLAVSLGDRVSIRDFASGEELLSFPEYAESLRFSADGRLLLGLTAGSVRVWSAAGTGPQALAHRRERLERVAEQWHRGEIVRLSQQRPMPARRVLAHSEWLKARGRQ